MPDPDQGVYLTELRKALAIDQWAEPVAEIRKRDPRLTKEQALAQAYRDDPERYEELVEIQRRVTARRFG